MVLFEDPQCPYCRQFEELNGPLITAAVDAGELAVEYRMRCFLGPESVRADNALALAAESGRFDDLRRALFAAQPPEGTGGFTTADLLRLGAQVGLTGSDFVSGVQEARYEKWVLRREADYQAEDPQGTPAAWLNGEPDRLGGALRQAGASEATSQVEATRHTWEMLLDVTAVEPNGRRPAASKSRSTSVTCVISSCWIFPNNTRAPSSSCSPCAAAR